KRFDLYLLIIRSSFSVLMYIIPRKAEENTIIIVEKHIKGIQAL
ncbi:hypothetical protein AAJ76_3290001849, partial [Vairimorpha ceranae]